jgi:hypothetical protein
MQQQQAGNSSTTTTSALTSPVTTTTVLVNGVAVLVPLPEVMDLLRAADKVSHTMYGDIKKAASIAKDAIEARFGVEAKVDHLMAIYAPLWLEITDDNIKRDFKNLLWIYADPQAQVTVPVAVKVGEAPKTEIVDAIKVLNGHSKSVITGVSKQIRDIHDAGRAPGAGRKKNATPTLPTPPLPNTGSTTVSTPLTPPAGSEPTVPGAPMLNPIAPSLGAHLMSMLPGGIPQSPTAPNGLPAPTPTPSANPAVSTGTLPAGSTNPKSPAAVLPAPSTPPAPVPAKQEQAGPTFFDELELRLSNPGDAAKIHAAVEKRGYKVTKATNVTPAKASTPVDATALLAEKLLDTTPATAIMQAASKAAALKIAKDAKEKAKVATK